MYIRMLLHNIQLCNLHSVYQPFDFLKKYILEYPSPQGKEPVLFCSWSIKLAETIIHLHSWKNCYTFSTIWLSFDDYVCNIRPMFKPFCIYCFTILLSLFLLNFARTCLWGLTFHTYLHPYLKHQLADIEMGSIWLSFYCYLP